MRGRAGYKDGGRVDCDNQGFSKYLDKVKQE